MPFRDECGVFGIYAPTSSEKISQLIYYGLFALQHRGQESAGIATTNGEAITHHKGMGLVSEVFNKENLAKLEGKIGIGHVRYSTTGKSHLMNAQPLVVQHRKSGLALAHNGNLVNTEELRSMLEEEGVVFQTDVDTEVIVNLLARYSKAGLDKALVKCLEIMRGAFSLVIMAEDKLIGVKDLHGFRPLCIGKTGDTWVLASETCALDIVGAEFVREVEPGEIVIIDDKGLTSIKNRNKSIKKAACIFELIYFARPDSVLDGINANSYRFKTGKILAQESMVEADRIIAVPDSGVPAAIGFSVQSGIPYGIGLVRNRYIGRTFIQPTQELREMAVRIKLNVLKKNVQGKRVVMVDDSIVRGTTIRQIIDMLRKAGAKEVHVRISSPPILNPCYFGIDTPSRDQLVSANYTIEEIRDMIHADSLAFLSIEGVQKATKHTGGYCRACFDGKYPMEVPDNMKALDFK